MMKCKYCGGNLTLEQAYCPHCGRPNEEAAQHVKDMEHYKSNFEDTKSDVYEVAEKNTEIMSHMIIITVLVILCVVVQDTLDSKEEKVSKRLKKTSLQKLLRLWVCNIKRTLLCSLFLRKRLHIYHKEGLQWQMLHIKE